MIEDFLLFPFLPCESAGRLRKRPAMLLTLAVISGLAIILFLLTWESIITDAIARLPLTASGSDREWVRERLAADEPFRLGMIPLFTFVRLSTTAGLLLWLAGVASAPAHPRFDQAFCLAGCAAIIPVGGDLLMVFIHAALPAIPASVPGLSWLPVSPLGNFAGIALIRTLNICTLWYIFAMGRGITVLFGTSVRRSVVLAAAAWMFSTLLEVWLLRLVGILLNFH